MRRSESKDSDLLNPSAPPGGQRRRNRNAMITIIMVVVIGVVVGVSYGRLFSGPNLPDQVTTTQVWSQWGMSLAYPAGLSPSLGAVSGSQADSTSGTVKWTWNNGHDVLVLLWLNTTAYDYTAGFQGIQSKVSQSGSNFTLVDHGNATMGSMTWQYETFRITTNGQTAYGTYALNFHAQSGRVYELLFAADASNTLSSLTYYGKTFSG